MERSRKLTLTDWTKANDALNLYFEGNKSKLTAHVKMSRTTVTAFFKPEPVREAEFRKLCLALRLNWQEVSTVQAIPNAPQPENEIDSLQQIRERCRQKILNQHLQTTGNWNRYDTASNTKHIESDRHSDKDGKR